MGMVFNLKKIIYIFFIFFLYSCSKKENNNIVDKSSNIQTEITDTAYINGFYLELLNKNNKTELNVIKGKDTINVKNININPPSYFLRNSNQQLESYSYPDINIKETIIVIGDIISDKEKEEHGLSDYKNLCGNSMQGILFQDKSVLASKTIITGTPVCVDISVDEKVFWGFAHD